MMKTVLMTLAAMAVAAPLYAADDAMEGNMPTTNEAPQSAEAPAANAPATHSKAAAHKTHAMKKHAHKKAMKSDTEKKM